MDVDGTALAIVERWLDWKGQNGLGRNMALFCTFKGMPIRSTANVSDMLKRRAKKRGIDKRVHPHGLRHTPHAMELIADEKERLHALHKQLGHSSRLATTSLYVSPLGADDVIEIGRVRAEYR